MLQAAPLSLLPPLTVTTIIVLLHIEEAEAPTVYLTQRLITLPSGCWSLAPADLPLTSDIVQGSIQSTGLGPPM